jgi:hypothetical protein
MILQRKSIIFAQHLKSDETMNYMVIEESGKTGYRLLNVNSGYIMARFHARTTEDIVHYIENVLKCKITQVI